MNLRSLIRATGSKLAWPLKRITPRRCTVLLIGVCKSDLVAIVPPKSAERHARTRFDWGNVHPWERPQRAARRHLGMVVQTIPAQTECRLIHTAMGRVKLGEQSWRLKYHFVYICFPEAGAYHAVLRGEYAHMFQLRPRSELAVEVRTMTTRKRDLYAGALYALGRGTTNTPAPRSTHAPCA